jgi:hypothetical protein
MGPIFVLCTNENLAQKKGNGVHSPPETFGEWQIS